MTDPTGGSIASLTTNMLKGLQQAQQTGGLQGLAAQVETLAAQLGTSTAAIVRGIAVSAAARNAVARSLGNWLVPWVQQAVNTGALTLSETVLGTGAAAASGGGLIAWWAGLAVAAKVAVVVAVVGTVIAGAWVAGTLAGDDPIGETDKQATPFTQPEDAQLGGTSYVGVGVYDASGLRIVSVRTTEAVRAGIPSCQFRHGGIDCALIADVRSLTKTYDTAAAATRELCGILEGPIAPPPLADGYQAPYRGGFVTVDDWGNLDFGVCEQVVGT